MTDVDDFEEEVAPLEVDNKKLAAVLNLNQALRAARLVREHQILDEVRDPDRAGATHITGRPRLFQTSSRNWRMVYEHLGLPIPDCPPYPTYTTPAAKIINAVDEAKIKEALTEAEWEARGTKVRVDDGERTCVGPCGRTLPIKKFPTNKDRVRDIVCRDCKKGGGA